MNNLDTCWQKKNVKNKGRQNAQGTPKKLKKKKTQFIFKTWRNTFSYPKSVPDLFLCSASLQEKHNLCYGCINENIA